MPATTPIYGITYPCAGDVINAAAFATFATSVDAALASVNLTATEALTRPVARLAGDISVAVAVNTEFTGTYNVVLFDNDAMANLGVSNDRLTVQTAGTYLVTYSDNISAGNPATATAVSVYKNGVLEARSKDDFITSASSFQLEVAALFDAVPGDFFTGSSWWLGTPGANDDSTSRHLTARLVNRP
jgi:hypothetical protein